MKQVVGKTRKRFMRAAKIILGLILFLMLTAFSNYAQEFILTTTTANTVSSRSSIDLPGLAGNPLAIIVATPVGDTERLNPHSIAAWYYNNKWNIFNTDHAVMPPGAKYKIQVFLKPDATHFLHVVTKENLWARGSNIDNPSLNQNPNAQVTIFQNHAPDNRPYYFNRFEAKAAYDSATGKWSIKNVNGNPLYPNTAYNVVITSGGAVGSNISQISLTPIPTPTPVTTANQTIPTAPQSPMPTSTGPCTKETAYQTPGKWARQKLDDLAMADRNFPKAQYKPVLAKAQKVVSLFMKASPEFKGIEASAKRIIRGDSYIPGGALPFGIDIFYAGYFCVGNDSNKVEMRGKVILSTGYGTTTVYFNSLRDVLESVQAGGAFLTTEGEEIFEFKKELGNFKGFTMIQPRVREEGHEAIIITLDNRLPYKPVTREQFLQARIKNYGTVSLFAADVTSLKLAMANMSPAERQSPALVRDIAASPGRAKLLI